MYRAGAAFFAGAGPWNSEADQKSGGSATLLTPQSRMRKKKEEEKTKQIY